MIENINGIQLIIDKYSYRINMADDLAELVNKRPAEALATIFAFETGLTLEYTGETWQLKNGVDYIHLGPIRECAIKALNFFVSPN